ncbi:helix-turn-helix domain-containing protein [Salipiger manganoxidans]|uniref:helix-turn-helix domain-containing protein n=1 Tax=Salipiger marinus TaxID=555512 RepID=UPI001E39DCFA|nr:helix-turn-helix domain-containing protein [Salipiger manganoxidans]MCD1620523.1 helix-turn-helix domain-containing protein [Salipiger manganoxidans]
MAKRPNPRAIRAARTYTIEEAALALNVSTGTVRSWVKAGLPLMQARRPYLILGDSLRAFLNSRASNAKVPLEQDQLYCFTCKAARVPMGLLVDCIPQTPKTARLLGLCEVCGGTCNRMVSRSQISLHSQTFHLAMKDGATA